MPSPAYSRGRSSGTVVALSRRLCHSGRGADRMFRDQRERPDRKAAQRATRIDDTRVSLLQRRNLCTNFWPEDDVLMIELSEIHRRLADYLGTGLLSLKVLA